VATIEIDVESAPGVVTGPGPITEIQSFRTVNRLNQAGSWTMTLPATEPQADLLTAQATVMGHVIINGVKTFLGGGAIDNMRKRVDNTGRLLLTAGGVGLLGEFSREALDTLILDDTGSQNLIDLAALKPTGWAVSMIGTSADFQRVFVNETQLAAWVAIAKQMGHSFTLKTVTSVERTLVYYVDLPTTIALHCVMNLNALEAEDNPDLATIVSIEDVSSSYEILNRAYVYGAGSGENQITMAAATVWPDDTTDITDPYTAPSGDEYFFDLATNRITNADSFARLGDQLRSKRLQFPDITLLENSDLGLEIAANTLVKAAVAQLERQRSPQTVYRFKLADLRQRIYPGDLIHIEARRYINGVRVVDIDDEVYVLSVTDNLDNNGVWTADVEASDVPAWPEDTVTQLVQQAQTALVQQAHPQLTGNIDTTTHREILVGGGLTQFYVFLADEAALINSVVLRYFTGPLELPFDNGGGTYNTVITGAVDVVLDPTLITGNVPNDTDSVTTPAAGVGHQHPHSHQHGSHTHTQADPHFHDIAWGYITKDLAETYTVSQIEFNINGEDSGATYRAGSHLVGSGWSEWYELDITDLVRNAATHRPETEGTPITSFYIEARPKPAAGSAKMCLITAQVQVRTGIRQVATF